MSSFFLSSFVRLSAMKDFICHACPKLWLMGNVVQRSFESDSGEEKRHMSVLIPKGALSEAVERASRMEEKGLKERSGEPADLPEDQDD